MTTVLVSVVMSLFIVSCGDKKDQLLDITVDSEKIPSMITEDVSTLISDSGITRYKLVADLWEVYDKAKEPYWYFPKGFYLERFNEDYFIEATVLSDTAWYFTIKKLWKLRGHVDVKNIVGDEFKSDELFWDQNAKKVYSDKFVEITKANGAYVEGYNFTSNQEMTAYSIQDPRNSLYPLKDEDINVEPADTVQTKPDNP
ncbi:MAG: LPS export ABC transporter periplasmic protein LptC [Dysgonamonadaceae bacterium]|nr:LPS export ABC transporter periplasmic protein LptC [Dysgonamonadaceae bacterium]